MDPRQWLRPPLNMPVPPPPNSFNSSSVDLNFSPKDMSPPPQHHPPPPPVPLPQPVGTDSLNQGPSSALRPLKRKRGRPRKHAPIVTDPRGRPPGAQNKHTKPSLNLRISGGSFTPHIILLQPGEDVAAKVWSFCEEGSRSSSVSIISANGTLSMAHIRPLTSAGGTVKLEGQYTLSSLSVTCSPSEDGGHRTSGLSITLVRDDGSIVAGSVSGRLIAASQIQLIMGTYRMDGNQKSMSKGKSGPSSLATPQNAPSVTPTSATSHGASSRSFSYVDLHGPKNRTKSRSWDETRSEPGFNSSIRH